MGKELAARKLKPRRILCSTSARTRQTCKLLCNQFLPTPECNFVHEIYEANRDELIECIKMQGGSGSPLLVIGHNPAMQHLALSLAKSDPLGKLNSMRAKYPTAALAVYDVPITDWRELALHSSRLDAYLLTC